MRRASTSHSLQLFPFLAVLVCAMGALILLLLVTANRMQKKSDAQAEAMEAKEAAPPAPSGPTPAQVAEKEAKRTARRETIAEAKKRQLAREAEWHRGVAEAELTLEERRKRVTDTQRELTELRDKLQATETNLQHLIDRKSQYKSALEQDTKLRAKSEREHADLSDAIVNAQKKLAELRRAHADAASKFAFIPYDGASGTTRRPIYIECTSTGIRFQPENELLDEADLKGFTEAFNPLLVASQRLMQYWREESVGVDNPNNPQRPYVLLLVRPKGTISYYVARKMLSQLGDNFGYELIEDDFALQLPPADPIAKVTIQRAVADTLKNRGEMLAAGNRIGEARLGEVLMGRNEELIEFGTLDDQVAAKVAKDESPFKKNSGSQGKSFAITRSPVHKDEVASGSFKSSLAERERRRAQGVPESLSSMVGRDNGTGPRGSGSGSGSGSEANGTGEPGTTRRQGRVSELEGIGGVGDGTDDTGPRGNGPLGFGNRKGPSSGGTAGGAENPDNPTGYALGDPFSREHRAMGRTGAGTADGGQSRGEQTAGNSSGNGGSGTGTGAGAGTGSRSGSGSGSGAARGQTGTRTGTRGTTGTPGGTPHGQVTGGHANNNQATNGEVANGMPSGAKAGKVIEIPTGGSPAGEGTGTRGTGTRGTGTRGTGTTGTAPRGVPGGKLPTGGETPSDLNVDGGGNPNDGGGDPNSDSIGTSTDPNAPYGRGPRSGGRAGSNSGSGSSSNSGSGSTQRRTSGGSNGSNNSGTGGVPEEEEDIGFRKPQPPEADSPQDGSEPGAGPQSNGRQTGRGQRGGTKTRSTDPEVQQPRTYGDNPEARKQLAASRMTASSVPQKREAARRRWGGSNTGQIGFERKVNVEVAGDRVFIARDDIEVVIEPGTTQEELMEAVLSALDEHSLGWGKPPSRFYWVPFLHFEVYQSGTKEYERLHGPLRDWGIFSEVDFKTGERPAKVIEKGVILPVTESNDSSATSVKSTKPKPSGSAATPVLKPEDSKPAPVKKSPFGWFKKLGAGR